jgi:hypothetical protein
MPSKTMKFLQAAVCLLLTILLAIVNTWLISTVSAESSGPEASTEEDLPTRTDPAHPVWDVAAMEPITQNEQYILFAARDNGRFALVQTGTELVWYSNPPDSQQDEYAKNRAKSEMASQLIVTYIKEGDSTPSRTSSFTENERLEFSEESDGFTTVHHFEDLGFSIPVRYAIDSDGLTASISAEKIQENGDGRILSISLLPFFGAAGRDEEGYILVPDGSGALIYLNNGKSGRNIHYAQRIYGDDRTVFQESAGSTTQVARLPVFGLKNASQAFLAVIEEGDTLATVEAAVSFLDNSYNNVHATWHLRPMDRYTIGDSASSVVNMIYQDIFRKDRHFSVRYYPLHGEKADYSGMASTYRQHLIQRLDIVPVYQPREMVIQFLGGVQIKESFLGIPVRRTIPLTTFDQAKQMIDRLSEAGITHQTVVLNNWTIANIRKTPVLGRLPSGKLGGTEGVADLIDFCRNEDVKLFLDLDLLYFERGWMASSPRKYSARLMSKLPAIQRSFLLSTLREGGQSVWGYLSSRKMLQRATTNASTQMDTLGAGLSLGSMGEYLYSDFSDPVSSREDILKGYEESIQTFLPDEESCMTSGGNAYMLGWTNLILHTPGAISGFDLEDEAVPFYQMALSGLAAMTLDPVNRSPDPQDLVLQTIETGTSLNFQWFFADPYILKNTRYHAFYGSDHVAWLEDAVIYYRQIMEAEEAIGEAFLTEHRKIQDQVYESVFSNGNRVIINYSDNPFHDADGTVQARGYAVRK